MFLSYSSHKTDDNSPQFKIELHFRRVHRSHCSAISASAIRENGQTVPVAGCVFTRGTIEFCQQTFTTRHTAEYLAAAT